MSSEGPRKMRHYDPLQDVEFEFEPQGNGSKRAKIESDALDGGENPRSYLIHVGGERL
jgi:hypothetical protein